MVVVGLGGVAALGADAQERSALAASPAAPAAIKPAKPPWGRIVMVGASASAGFTESELLGGPNTAQYRLSRYLDAALLVPHEPVRSLASTMFFLQADAQGRRQIDLAVQAKPTLVVGLDFLFWFCYGGGSTDAERLQRFERGLKLLEPVPCPLVVGDIPDASSAVNRMLAPEDIPSAHAMSAANRRLKEWAALRKQVVVVPLSGFMRAASANRALTTHGRTLAQGQTRALLQEDRLHPSASGCAVLALSRFDTFLTTRLGGSADEVRWDSGEVLRLTLGALPKAPVASAKPDVPAVQDQNP